MGSDHHVDLAYRDLALGRRVRLTHVRPSSGYVELLAPMPVGSDVVVTTEEGAVIHATVTEVREQVANSQVIAGMTIQPRLDGETAGAGAAWWSARVELPDLAKVELAPQIGIVRSKRGLSSAGIPELIDDGRKTAVQEAIDPGTLGPATAGSAVGPFEPSLRESHPSLPVLVDDGKRTVAMEAVDLAALGLEPMTASGSIPIAAGATSDEDDGAPESGPTGGPESGPAGDAADAGTKKKRKRR